MQESLIGLRVVEFAHQIAGPYAGKLLVDAGADVVKVEPAEGDSLRRAFDSREEDAPLFRFLNAGKRSVVGDVSDPHVEALVAEADLVIAAHGLETDTGPRLDVAALRARHPGLVVLSVTPYGTEGPWAERRATEFTLQAESGSLGIRGVMGEEPFQAGGRISEWSAGTFGAVGALAAVFRARGTGQGEHVDTSILEAANLVFTNYSETMNRLMNGGPGTPEHAFLRPTIETPSIERTSNGFVGFCTNTRQQFSDFLLMIERPDLREDEALAQVAGRLMRFAEWSEILQGWMPEHTTEEIIELASLLRIPVAPVCNGETVQAHEQLAERGVFVDDAEKRFVQPRRSYRIDDTDPPPPRPVPRLGEHTETASFSGERGAFVPIEGPLPLAGLRVLDLTAWWAGPSSTHVLATLGAEVIHVESASRPDGMRMVGGMMAGHFPEWWEASAHFMHANSNKQDVTLDLGKPEGVALVERLVRECDALVENFTPRVLEGFGLTWERLHELNPNLVMVRMPAFGLSGPWRDNTGFAQTMEQLSGMAWVTGHEDDQPRIPRGPCDPLAGMHGAFSLLVALAQRARSGRGHHVESTMVESALNVAAEGVVEWSAHERRIERMGNRSALAAPQGLYPCAEGEPGDERWLAISVTTDEQWEALVRILGAPDWATDPALRTQVGRHAAHATLDAALRAWTREQNREALAQTLRDAGIPASPVANASRLLETNPQLQARGYFETPAHPTVGPMPIPSLPFRYASVDTWLRTPAPTLGEHNQAVLGGLLGLGADDLDRLTTEEIIGTRPKL